MGYTHYYRQSSDLDDLEWRNITNGFIKLLAQYDESPVDIVFHHDYITIDGGYETFMVSKKMPKDEKFPSLDGYNFCKTARLPYDELVTACLIYLYYEVPNKFSISSDGDWSEWAAGRRLYNQTFNTNIEEDIFEKVEA